jgi:hypothetical protein
MKAEPLRPRDGERNPEQPPGREHMQLPQKNTIERQESPAELPGRPDGFDRSPSLVGLGICTVETETFVPLRIKPARKPYGRLQ